MGKILAIDFGLKRTGLAITDDTQKFAFGFKTVDTAQLMECLITTIAKENVQTILLGMPKRLNLEDSHVTQNVRLFQEALAKKVSIPIVVYDERFTSKMAFQTMVDGGLSAKKRRDKALIDEISATILLQSYLSSNENKSRF